MESVSRIRDPGWGKIRIRGKHFGSATLIDNIINGAGKSIMSVLMLQPSMARSLEAVALVGASWKTWKSCWSSGKSTTFIRTRYILRTLLYTSEDQLLNSSTFVCNSFERPQHILKLGTHSVLCSVPDPKLIISDLDPDPQIENQEFRIRIQIRIQIRILLWTRDGEKKLPSLVNMKTQMGRSLEVFQFFKYCVWHYDAFVHILELFKTYF